MNYTKMEGVNDKTRNDSFRKWTGMPQTTRSSKMPGLSLNHAKLVAVHRKMGDVEKVATSIDSGLDKTGGFVENKRNISQMAWSKIR